MNAPDDMTQIEDEVRAAMRFRRMTPTPDCPTPDVLLALADARPAPPRPGAVEGAHRCLRLLPPRIRGIKGRSV